MKMNVGAKRGGTDFSWLPRAEEWDFRSVTPKECRVAAYWEYEREHASFRIGQRGGSKVLALPPAFRQTARELFPQAWVTLTKEQRGKIAESFSPLPALQVRKLRDFMKRLPPNSAHPNIIEAILHNSYVFVPNFRLHGVEVVIKAFEKWARSESKNHPPSRRAQAAELPFDPLKWLAVARLETARSKLKRVTIQMAREAVVEYQRVNPELDANGVLPIYGSDGAWLKAKQSAGECLNKVVNAPATLLAELA